MKFVTKNLVVELVAMTFVMVMLELAVFPGCILGWNPSPLWVIVLLVAMRFGSPAGIVGGAVAAALHLWVLTRGGYPFQELMHRHPGMLSTPVLFLFVGMYLGEKRERLARRSDHYRLLVEDLTRKLDSNEIRRLNLERGHLEMEKRIAGQSDTLLDVHNNLNRLNAADSEEELWTVLADIARRGLRAESCGIWRTAERELVAGVGAPETMPPIAPLAVRKRGIATLVDWFEERGDEAPGAELAGLLDDAGGPLAITASGMGFSRLNRNAVVFFELLIERAGVVLRELRRLDGLRRASISDPELGLGSESYLRNRIREQALLARRHGADLSILACSFAHPSPQPLAGRLEVILACSIRSAVRGSDGIAYFASEPAFVIMLPQTNLAGAGVVMRKIAASLDHLDLPRVGGLPPAALKWNAVAADGAMNEEALFEQLFAGMAARKTGAA